MIFDSVFSRRGAQVACAAAVCALVAGAAFALPGESAYADQANTIGMHRMYNPTSGEHFYTSSSAERNMLIKSGWQYEGTGWLAPKESSTPVYRMYSGTDHHYTTDAGERDLLQKSGWQYEGVGWYSADAATGEPLYRQYNPNVNPKAATNNSGSHNYTTSKSENDDLKKIGWQEEGVGWYAIPGTSTIENDGSYMAVEADMNLKGTGTGYHAKIDISSTAGNAVASFGIQYEEHIDQFPTKTCYLVENVMSHATVAGPMGKEYLYVSAANQGQTAKVRIAWFKNDNTLRFYVNDREISRTSSTFEDGLFIVAAEGSVAHDGDTINATFKNVKVKGKGVMRDDLTWNDSAANEYFGLQGSMTIGSQGLPDMAVTGTADIPGLNPATGTPWDWDTCFSAVDPRHGTSGHPLSAVINAAVY